MTFEEQLEDKINQNEFEKYKSKGELMVANTLRLHEIPFVYEPHLRMPYRGKNYNLRPDFFLPFDQLIIEYYGRAGHRDYDHRTELKKRIYRSNHVDAIAVYPWHLAADWPNSLMNELVTIPNQRTSSRPEITEVAPKSYEIRAYKASSECLDRIDNS